MNIRENCPRKCFWTKEKETRVKFNPGLSANRPSNNWALSNSNEKLKARLENFQINQFIAFAKVNLDDKGCVTYNLVYSASISVAVAVGYIYKLGSTDMYKDVALGSFVVSSTGQLRRVEATSIASISQRFGCKVTRWSSPFPTYEVLVLCHSLRCRCGEVWEDWKRRRSIYRPGITYSLSITCSGII